MKQNTSDHYQSARNLLSRYRDVRFQLEVCIRQLTRTSTPAESASLGLKIQEYQHFMHSIEETVSALRRSHRHGESYYWILYFSFLSSNEIRNVEDMLDALLPHAPSIASQRTYYRERHKAIESFALLFWGFSDTTVVS